MVKMVSKEKRLDLKVNLPPPTFTPSCVPSTGVTMFQVRVKATDAGVPPRTATAIVEVKVQRDEGDLKFNSQNYKISVTENKALNTVIGNVRAAPGVRSFTHSSICC